MLGAATIGTGIMDLAYRAFDPAEQPVQAWGDNVPGNHIFACIVGIALVIGGAAILGARSKALGAMILAGVYAIFAVFWSPRLITAPAVLGKLPGVYVGILAGIASQVIVICTACIIYGTRTVTIQRIFGICVILFGLQHLINLHSPNNLTMVPEWMPLGPLFWVAFTGIAFVLAGVAIVIRVADTLAARLLAAMLFVFSAVTLIPILVAAPGIEANWGANLYNIVAAGCALVLAARQRSQNT